MTQCLYNLDLLKTIMPSQDRLFLSKGDMKFLSGQLSSQRRLKHTLLDGREWIESSEIQLMMSMIIGNGCYSNKMLVIPVSYNEILRSLFKKFKDWQRGLEIHKLQPHKWSLHQRDAAMNVTMNSEQNPRTLADLEKAYHQQQNRVIETIIFPLIDDIKKINCKIMFFPINQGNTHWKCVFVFNPLHIQGQTTNKGAKKRLSCYCTYNSMNDYSELEYNKGIIWFLNLVHSVKFWLEKRKSKNDQMNILFPFGPNIGIEKHVRGTQDFPRLRMHDQWQYLPFQNDAYNCGVAIVATFAIFCCDFLHSPTQDYSTIFDPQTLRSCYMEGKKEYQCFLKPNMIKKHNLGVGNDDESAVDTDDKDNMGSCDKYKQEDDEAFLDQLREKSGDDLDHIHGLDKIKEAVSELESLLWAGNYNPNWPHSPHAQNNIAGLIKDVNCSITGSMARVSNKNQGQEYVSCKPERSRHKE